MKRRGKAPPTLRSTVLSAASCGIGQALPIRFKETILLAFRNFRVSKNWGKWWDSNKCQGNLCLMVLVMSRSMNATGNIGRLWWNACRISKFWRCASDFWNKIFSDFSLPFASFCFHSFDLFVCFPQPRARKLLIFMCNAPPSLRSLLLDLGATMWQTTMQKRCVNDGNPVTVAAPPRCTEGAPRWCAVEPPRCQTALASLRELREDVSEVHDVLQSFLFSSDFLCCWFSWSHDGPVRKKAKRHQLEC